MFNKHSPKVLNHTHKGKWLAIAFTVLAGFAVFFSISALFNPVPVVVAKKDIAESALIEADQLEIKKVAERDCQKGTFRRIEEVAGQVSADNIFAGQQIISRQLSGQGEAGAAESSFNPGQTEITVTTQQATWSGRLRVGDLVTVTAVYPEKDEVMEVAVGRIVKPTNGTIIRNLKSIQEGQSTSPAQTEISFVTDIKGGKRVLLALKTSQLVYLMPRHPQLGGVD